MAYVVFDLFDVSTDSVQGYIYLRGTYYKKHVSSIERPSVNSAECIFERQLANGNYEFKCFEQDIVWGILTLVLLFLPGLLLYSNIHNIMSNDNEGELDETINKKSKLKSFLKKNLVFVSLFFPFSKMGFKVKYLIFIYSCS